MNTPSKPIVYHDHSIDLETLDTEDDAVIIEIAIAEFDRNTGEIFRTFQATVDLEMEVKRGATISADTLKFWLDQKADVLRGRLSNSHPAFLVADSVLEFFTTGARSMTSVWGNGATFDVTKLGRFLRRYEVTPPWENNELIPGGFRFVRDMRTLLDVAREKGFNDKAIPFDGEKHDALNDAIHQAKVISAAWQYVTK